MSDTTVKEQMKKDIVESKRVRKAIQAEEKHCFRNAWRVVGELDEYKTAEYVEGHVFNPDYAIVYEHGWVEKEGVIIDPTLPDHDLVYFAGLRFAGHAGLAEASSIPKNKSADDLPIFQRFPAYGKLNPDFLASFNQAQGYAKMISCERQ